MTSEKTKGKKILVVDDDALFLNILTEWFTLRGFSVLTTTNPSEGLELLEKEEGIGAILLDLLIGPVNGLKILEQIKKNKKTKDIPVFIITQLGEDTQREKAKKLGAEDYLIKSDFSLKQLTEKIDRLLS